MAPNDDSRKMRAMQVGEAALSVARSLDGEGLYQELGKVFAAMIRAYDGEESADSVVPDSQRSAWDKSIKPELLDRLNKGAHLARNGRKGAEARAARLLEARGGLPSDTQIKRMPRLEAIKAIAAFAVREGLPPEKAEPFYDTNQAQGWMFSSGNPVRDVGAWYRRYCARAPMMMPPKVQAEKAREAKAKSQEDACKEAAVKMGIPATVGKGERDSRIIQRGHDLCGKTVTIAEACEAILTAKGA